jgi:hypothetical protein
MYFFEKMATVKSKYQCGQSLWFRLKLECIRQHIVNDPSSATYRNLALSAVDDDLDSDELVLFHNTDAARDAIERARLESCAEAVRRRASPHLSESWSDARCPDAGQELSSIGSTAESQTCFLAAKFGSKARTL